MDKLINLLLKWAKYRERARAVYFDKWIEPTYENAQVVAQDLLTTIDEIERMVVTGKTLREIVKFTETKRMKYVTLRDALRVYLNDSRKVRWLGDFDEGLRLLLEGVLGQSDNKAIDRFEQRRVRVAVGSDSESLRLKGHALLDVLYRVAHHSDIFPSEERMIAARQQKAAIRRATEMMGHGYLQLKRRAYPSPD